jgi:hypothetical protein
VKRRGDALAPGEDERLPKKEAGNLCQLLFLEQWLVISKRALIADLWIRFTVY